MIASWLLFWHVFLAFLKVVLLTVDMCPFEANFSEARFASIVSALSFDLSLVTNCLALGNPLSVLAPDTCTLKIGEKPITKYLNPRAYAAYLMNSVTRLMANLRRVLASTVTGEF
jgi:hypothetical protein